MLLIQSVDVKHCPRERGEVFKSTDLHTALLQTRGALGRRVKKIEIHKIKKLMRMEKLSILTSPGFNKLKHTAGECTLTGLTEAMKDTMILNV